jgi:hypothetical protein
MIRLQILPLKGKCFSCAGTAAAEELKDDFVSAFKRIFLCVLATSAPSDFSQNATWFAATWFAAAQWGGFEGLSR